VSEHRTSLGAVAVAFMDEFARLERATSPFGIRLRTVELSVPYVDDAEPGITRRWSFSSRAEAVGELSKISTAATFDVDGLRDRATVSRLEVRVDLGSRGLPTADREVRHHG
jgi:hypothetical protein